MELREYSVWSPPDDDKNKLIFIRGSRTIHKQFQEAFPSLKVEAIRSKTPHKPFDYSFWVIEATTVNEVNFGHWLQTQQEASGYEYEPIEIAKSTFPIKAIDWHGNSKFAKVARNAKPYNKSPSKSHIQNADRLGLALAWCIQQDTLYNNSDFLVAVPSKDKVFDLPQYLTKMICEKLDIANGSQYLEQVRDKKHSQKDLEDVQEKRNNVRGLFAVKANHPFKGKIVTIIDDIYRSGATLDELATVLTAVGANVRGLVATKTFRD